MSGTADVIKKALTPYLGPVVADTCVRATALSLGKSYEDLGKGDLPVLEGSICRYLSAVAPKSVIETIIRELQVKVA